MRYKKGHIPWNKGTKGICKGFIGKHTEKSKQKMSKTHKRLGTKPPSRKGSKMPNDSKIKIRETCKRKGITFPITRYWLGKKRPNIVGFNDKGHIVSAETKRKIREWQINHPNRKFKDTSIELKIEAELQRRNINYQKQVPLCKIAIVDFYLPEYRIVIQCDGDYWHNLPKWKGKDEQQTKVLTFNGFNVYRFWEYEINKSAGECINQLQL